MLNRLTGLAIFAAVLAPLMSHAQEKNLLKSKLDKDFGNGILRVQYDESGVTITTDTSRGGVPGVSNDDTFVIFWNETLIEVGKEKTIDYQPVKDGRFDSDTLKAKRDEFYNRNQFALIYNAVSVMRIQYGREHTTHFSFNFKCSEKDLDQELNTALKEVRDRLETVQQCSDDASCADRTLMEAQRKTLEALQTRIIDIGELPLDKPHGKSGFRYLVDADFLFTDLETPLVKSLPNYGVLSRELINCAVALGTLSSETLYSLRTEKKPAEYLEKARIVRKLNSLQQAVAALELENNPNWKDIPASTARETLLGIDTQGTHILRDSPEGDTPKKHEGTSKDPQQEQPREKRIVPTLLRPK